MKGQILSKAELLKHLEDTMEAISKGNSPEGTFSWRDLGEGTYDVIAFVRTSGTFGQDASYLIGSLD